MKLSNTCKRAGWLTAAVSVASSWSMATADDYERNLDSLIDEPPSWMSPSYLSDKAIVSLAHCDPVDRGTIGGIHSITNPAATFS